MNGNSNYVLDTNILIADPAAIDKYLDEGDVIIPWAAYEELEAKKASHTAVGKKTRDLLKKIERTVKQPRCDGHRLIIHSPVNPPEIHGAKPCVDNEVLKSAWSLAGPGRFVCLVTNDRGLRIKAAVSNLRTQSHNIPVTDFSIGKIREVPCDDVTISALYTNGAASLAVNIPGVFDNDCVLLKGSTDAWTAPAFYRGGTCHILKESRKVYGIKAKNLEQRYFLSALLNPEIQLIACAGYAGSGKTILSLAAGLQQMREGKYGRMVLSKMIEDVGNSIGFLKGTKDEKLREWNKPFLDNLDILTKDPDRTARLFESGNLEFEALTFMRGRSFSDSFVIMDELQNMPPKYAKMIVSRLGLGSKMVLLGDLDQIDHPRLNKEYNGLRYIMERIRGLKNAAVFNLEQFVRNPAMADAVARL